MATMLDAVINLKDNFSNTLQQVDNAVRNFSRTTKKMGDDIQKAGKNIAKVGSSLTKSITLPVVGVGIAAAKVGMDFESGMSQVGATMGFTVDQIKNGDESFKKLSDTAKKMGRETQYSATEASEALNYLALAGYDVEKSTEMLPKVLNLAAAGGMDLAYASDLVTDSMAALGLTTKDADVFIDQMARTSQKANTNVAQLGEAILMVGTTAKDLKGGTLELNTALGLLANVGIKGSEGGTKLRNIIMAMTPTTDAATEAFKKLKVETYDLVTGELKGLDEIFGDLNKSMSAMNTKEKKELLSSIFKVTDMAAVGAMLSATAVSVEDLDFALGEMGINTSVLGIDLNKLASSVKSYKNEQEFAKDMMDQFGVTAEQARVMYEGLNSVVDGGETSWSKLEAQIKDSEGAAKEMADVLIHNLKGAITIVKSALEGLGIRIYEVLKPGLDRGVESIQKFIDFLNNLSDAQLKTAMKIAGFAAAIGPILLIVGKTVFFIGKLVAIFGKLGLAITEAGGIVTFLVGIFTGPVAIIIAVIAAIAVAAFLIIKHWKTIKTFFINLWEGVKATFSSFVEWLQAIPARIGLVIESIKLWFTETLPNGIKAGIDMVVNFFTSLPERIAYFLGVMIGYISTIPSRSLLFFTQLKEQASQIITEMIARLIAYISALPGRFSTFFEQAKVEAIRKMSEMVTSVVTFVGELPGKLTSIFTNVVSTIRNGAKNAYDAAIDWFKKIPEKISDLITGALGKITGMIDKVRKSFSRGFSTGVDIGTGGSQLVNSNTRGIQQLAKGTNNWEGGIVQVHEKGGEIIDLPGGSRVYPHDKSVSMARNQGRKESNHAKSSSNPFTIIIENMVVREESDITQIAKEFVRQIHIARLNTT